MTGIPIPKAFHDFVAFYAVDAIEFDEISADDTNLLIDNALHYLTRPSDRAALRDFLTQVLATNPSDDKLQALWSNSGPMLAYNKEAYRSFFNAIRNRL